MFKVTMNNGVRPTNNWITNYLDNLQRRHKLIQRKPFYDVVKSPWITNFRDAPRDFEPKSTIYDDGEFFISELYDDSYLFFKKIGEKFFAFNNLAGHDKDYIPKIKQALIDGDTKGDFLIQRGIEQIQKWERSLTTAST